MEQSEKTLDMIVNLCKNRGYVFPGSEIYGGLANSWDYGPLGVEFKNNVKKAWLKKFVQESPYNVGLDAAIIMNPQTWVTTGHVSSFSDPLLDCRACKARHRADKLIGEEHPEVNVDAMSFDEMDAFIAEHEDIVCPVCGKHDFTPIRKFNLMFKTAIGVTEDSSSTCYLRPETAQGIFVNFANIQRTTRRKLPFGVCQVGKAFRNEITPGNFTFRTREFEQMECEFFCKPGTDLDWFAYWKDYCENWLLSLGIKKEHLRLRDHEPAELAFYSRATTDIEYAFPFTDWGELWGIADRTNYDLTRHQEASGKSLEYFDSETNEHYIPYVIEPSLGADRVTLAFLCEAYDEEVVDAEKNDVRVVLHLHPALAPYKAAILPLSKKAKVAVIGQMAKKPRHQGAGSSLVNSIKIDSAYNTMFEEGIDVIYADGYAMTKKEKKNSPETYIADAVEAAKKADVAVLFIGLTDEFESEGFDRTHLRIPPEHVALLSAIRGVTENIVVVLAGGAVVEMPWIGEAKALLNSYLGGEASGSAVTDILFGDVNPSGKLAETYPFSLEDTPCYNNFPGHTATVEYREGLYIGYRYYDTAKKNVLFPFGFGLSYTTFEYSDLKVSADSIKDTGTLKVSFKIKNTGDRDGAEVAGLYVAQENSTIFRPEKELKGFKKVFLKAGEEKEVEIELSKRAFAFYDVDLGDWHVETDNYKILVGASSRDIRLEGSVKVESTVDAPVKDLRETMPAYYSADVMNVPDDQFKALLGHEIPESEIHDYPNLTFANTLEDSACGKNGAKLCKMLRKFVGSEGMACSIALQTPVKNFVSMSMGVFSEELGHQLLDILNDKKPMGRGILVLIGKAIPAVVKGLPNLLKNI